MDSASKEHVPLATTGSVTHIGDSTVVNNDNDRDLNTTPAILSGKLEDASTQTDGSQDAGTTIVQACELVCVQLQNMINDISVLGSVMSLYKAADAVHSALHDLKHFYEIKAPSMQIGQEHRKHKITEREHHEHIFHTFDKQVRETEAVKVFEQLVQAIERFNFAFRDFHDYFDTEGELTLKSLLGEAQVVHAAWTFYANDGGTGSLVDSFTIERGKKMVPLLLQMPAIFKRFTKEGIPSIKVSQERSATLRFNAATVATFFAGVSATTLQFSVIGPGNTLTIAVNTLWFVSLVLSIGSATSALLAMTWQQAVFSSPARDLPWYVIFWTRHGYLALLVTSVLTFIAGLLTYIYNTQNRVSFWITAGCVAVCGFGLSIVIVWIEYELLEFSALRKLIRSEHPFSKNGHYFFSQARDALRPLFRRVSPDKKLSDKVRKGIEEKEIFYTQLQQMDKNTPTSSSKLNDKFQVKRVIQREYAAITSQAVQHMSVSPHGQWVIVCYRETDQCCLFRLSVKGDAELSSCEVLNHKKSPVAQVMWAPSSGDQIFVTRARDGVRVWNIKVDEYDKAPVSCVSYLFDKEIVYSGEEVLWVDWYARREILVLVADDNSTSIRKFNVLQEIETSSHFLPSIENLHFSSAKYDQKNDLVFMTAVHHVNNQTFDCLFLHSLKQAQLDLTPIHDGSTAHYQHPSIPPHHRNQKHGNRKANDTTFGIIPKIPLAHNIESLEVYPEEKMFLISYEHSPPELWAYDPDASPIHVERKLELKPPKSLSVQTAYWDDAFLAGPAREEFVSSVNSMIYFWDRHDGKLKRVLEFIGCPANEDPEIAWSSAAGQSVIILGAWGNGEMAICTNAWDEDCHDSAGVYVPPPQSLTMDV